MTREKLELRGPRGFRVSQDWTERLDRMEHQDKTEHRGNKGHQDKTEPLDRTGHRGKTGQTESP